MFRVQYTNSSTHRVVLPYKTQKQALLTLAQAFVTQENSLPPEDRTRYTASIQAALATALAAQAASAAQEVSRKSASETLKRLDAAARTTVSQIRSLMEGRFAYNPEQAQTWGFFVRQSGRGAGNILTPRGRDEIIACLNQYITTEEARPIGEQFAEPPLNEVIALRDELNQRLQQRNQARQERLTHNAALDEACTVLAKELRLALTALLLNNYDGEPERPLGRWGFQLVARTTRLPREEEQPLAPEPEAEPA
ncbi:MAG: hypothetical protein IPM53_21505 [Anaerolineaceae bacterium]|nr:hypothetical protein [Anaerolineaceae bacterium]